MRRPSFILMALAALALALALGWFGAGRQTPTAEANPGSVVAFVRDAPHQQIPIVQGAGHTTTILSFADIDAGELAAQNVDVLYIQRSALGMPAATQTTVLNFVKAGGGLLSEHDGTELLINKGGPLDVFAGTLVDGFFVPSGTVSGNNLVTVTDPGDPLAASLPGTWTSKDPIGVFHVYSGLDPSLQVPIEVLGTNKGDLPVVASACIDSGRVVPLFTDFQDFDGVGFTPEEKQLLLNAIDVAAAGCGAIEKTLLDGDLKVCELPVDCVIEDCTEIGIYLPDPTLCAFEIAYTGPAAKVIDTVPAEFECVNLVPTAGAATCSDTSKGKGNSANRIEWDVPAGSNTLTVTIQTVASPGKGHKDPVTGERTTLFKPTSCGPLPINDGATAFEVDPATGELVLDADGNPIVIVGPSNALQATAVAGTKPCEDIIIDADGTATAGDGLGTCRSPVTPGAVQVTKGDLLSSFPDGPAHSSGLDWFDQDGNGVWTLTCNGDDLHLEAPEFCPTGIRDGNHDLGQDCKVLDFNGDLANGQQVDCDLEVAFNFGTTVTVCPDPLIKYFDADADGAYDDGEDIVLDFDNDGVFD